MPLSGSIGVSTLGETGVIASTGAAADTRLRSPPLSRLHCRPLSYPLWQRLVTAGRGRYQNGRLANRQSPCNIRQKSAPSGVPWIGGRSVALPSVEAVALGCLRLDCRARVQEPFVYTTAILGGIYTPR
ncbi:hypothetical protein NDU88_007184 [Pleurodeles waltl]|uniref:Uncharacterized protein n=1 Tax=Pleurodeles waltl TaxID=8319 RepID=A0AAV7NX92_PLEWA|nr:hypothetical protein NDU88_007184 [Pleurodeles waltl]